MTKDDIALENSAKKLVDDHRTIIAKFRKLINAVLDKLEEDMQAQESGVAAEGDLTDEQRAFWWGSRESAVSVLVKLAQLCIKLIPLEQKLWADEPAEAEDSINEHDIEILQRYVERVTHEAVA